MGGRGTSAMENSRIGLAKQIAKEIYGTNMGNERLEREARRLLQFNEGEELFDGDYIETSNGIERSQKYLKEWLKDLRKTR